MAIADGVLLHGRGRTPEEMLELAHRIAVPGIRWVAPAAEDQSWYPHRFMDSVTANEPFLSQAVAACDRALDEVTDDDAPRRGVVVGFSQGACVATEYALRHTDRCAAVIAFTGGLIGPDGTEWRPLRGSLAGLPVLLTGSDIDEWVPEERVRETARVLTDLGANVRLRIYRGRDHLVSDEEILEARHFLEQVL